VSASPSCAAAVPVAPSLLSPVVVASIPPVSCGRGFFLSAPSRCSARRERVPCGSLTSCWCASFTVCCCLGHLLWTSSFFASSPSGLLNLQPSLHRCAAARASPFYYCRLVVAVVVSSCPVSKGRRGGLAAVVGSSLICCLNCLFDAIRPRPSNHRTS
jgi:hypothetical protein